MSVLLAVFAFLQLTFAGPGVDVEKTSVRHPLESVQPVGPCLGSGCR